MRIYHQSLIPKLCREHLLAVWNEGNTVYKIITCPKVTTAEGKLIKKICNKCGYEAKEGQVGKKCLNCGHGLDGYFYHPAVKEFKEAPLALYERLQLVRDEMLKRGYNPINLTTPNLYVKQALGLHKEKIRQWQTLEEQIAVLKSKHCACKL